MSQKCMYQTVLVGEIQRDIKLDRVKNQLVRLNDKFMTLYILVFLLTLSALKIFVLQF